MSGNGLHEDRPDPAYGKPEERDPDRVPSEWDGFKPEDMPEELRIEFKRPIEAGGKMFTEIILREPTGIQDRQAKQVLKAGKGGFDGDSVSAYQIKLISLVSGVPIVVVEQLQTSKINRAMEYLSVFTRVAIPTPPQSSR